MSNTSVWRQEVSAGRRPPAVQRLDHTLRVDGMELADEAPGPSGQGAPAASRQGMAAPEPSVGGRLSLPVPLTTRCSWHMLALPTVN